MYKKLLSMLLALALLLSLAACGKDPAPTTPSTEPTVITTVPAPTEPDALAAYEAARAALEASPAVTLDVVVLTETTVGQQVYSSRSQQVLTWAAMDTAAPVVFMEEALVYDYEDLNEEELEYNTYDYCEVYTGGTLYMQLNEEMFFSSTLAQADVENRYAPVVLLDQTLYDTVTADSSEAGLAVTFEAPTAAEAWAMPADAQLQAASGTASIDGDGKLQKMTYALTYTYGSAQVSVAVESTPRQQPETVEVPEKPEDYTKISYVDALRTYMHAADRLVTSTGITSIITESIVTQAAATMYNQQISVDLYGTGKDLMTKINTDVYAMDYSSNTDLEYKLEEVFRNGKYTYSEDGALPTTESGITAEEMESYAKETVYSNLFYPTAWKDVRMEDLGSVYLLSLDMTADSGDLMQNYICETLWRDASYLNKLASKYETTEITGYLAVDKYTGVFTAGGCNYAGVHTIDGTDYTLALQSDQSVCAPSADAYKEITDESAPETEPEDKATPLFYKVTGKDGQQMWLLGTIHVGDARTAYLPKEIYDAFAASDALAMEVDLEAFEALLKEDDELAQQVSGAYYYSDGTMTADHIDAALYEKALKYMKASGNYNMNTVYMKPSVWCTALENFFLQQGNLLTSGQGVEIRLTELAKQQDKKILEVEDSLFQIEMLNGWSEPLQELLLKETLEYSGEEYWLSVHELYELWCDGDEDAMRKALAEEVDISQLTEEEKKLYDEYWQAMDVDRNEGMLDVAIEYLESDEVVFYAVGLAHLLNGENGLVNALREAGYTVELVSYQ